MKLNILKIRLLFDRYDKFLEDKKSSERVMVMSMPALIVMFCAYLYIFPIVDGYLSKVTNQKNRLQSELQQSNLLLSANQESDLLLNIKQEIIDTKKEIDKIAKQKNMIEDGIYKLSFKEERWEMLLDSIAQNSSNHNLNLELFEFNKNKISENITSTNIEISGKGEFLNLLKFIDELERNHHFINIKKLELKSGTKIDFKIIIEVWRIDV